MLLSRTKKILIFTTIIAIAILAVYIALFFQLKNKNEGISILKNEVENITKKDAEQRVIKDTIKETEKERAELNSYFVSSDGVVDFIETIEALATDTAISVEITSVSIKKAPEHSDIIELLRISIKTDGRWINMFHFLSLVETLPFDIFVERVNFSKEKDKIASRLWNGAFDISVAKLRNSVSVNYQHILLTQIIHKQ